MAKKPLSEIELPCLPDVISEEQTESDLIENKAFDVMLRVPMIVPSDGYAVRHVETKLSHSEAKAFKAVMLALIASKVKLRNGRLVKRPADVYRWIAEEIVKQYANNH